VSQEDFFTWSEAVKAFVDAGLSESTLRRRVNEGAISAILPEGRVRGKLYPKAQVLAALPRKAAKKITETDIPGATDWVQERDLPRTEQPRPSSGYVRTYKLPL